MFVVTERFISHALLKMNNIVYNNSSFNIQVKIQKGLSWNLAYLAMFVFHINFSFFISGFLFNYSHCIFEPSPLPLGPLEVSKLQIIPNHLKTMRDDG